MRIQLPVSHNWQIDRDDPIRVHKPASVAEFEAKQRDSSANDPLPNPEPASPSLPEPDPGVFRHEPGPEPQEEQEPA